ncbi:MAG: hypothetical protein J5857_07545, partial [Treponema sp.]|nr:hypothetical protein [Treponema sp.]
LGNESGYGENLRDGARLVKSLDSTRPVHYESTYRLDDISDEDLDFVSEMYTHPDDVRKFLTRQDEKRPFILCEYCHAMGNGPGDLEDYHNLFMESDRICGGLIWEWADHAVILGKTDDGRIKYGYGGDSGEEKHDSNFCMDALCYPDRIPHTGLLEAKQVYRPVRVEKGNKSGQFKIKSLLRFINAGDYLECRYELSCDGKILSNGRLDFSVPPMGETEISVPEAAGDFDTDTFIRFIFLAKNNYSVFKDGDEVCFDQLKIHETQKQIQETKGKISACIESALYFKIQAGEISYIFNRRTAQFDGINVGGENIISKPVEYNFFRAPIDNDRMKDDWYSAHLNNYTVKVYETSLKEEDGKAVIHVSESFGWLRDQPFAKLNAEYVIDGSGALEIKCDAEFSNKVDLLPRFGLRFFVPKHIDTVEYFGYGPYESYIDKHQASYIGNFNSRISDMHEDYIRPQENGSHCGCTWMKAYGLQNGIQFENPKGFSFNASEYTQEELSAKKHNFELEKSEYNILCVDFAMAGVGSAACGPALAQKFRIPLPKTSGNIRLMPLRKN